MITTNSLILTSNLLKIGTLQVQDSSAEWSSDILIIAALPKYTIGINLKSL